MQLGYHNPIHRAKLNEMIDPMFRRAEEKAARIKAAKAAPQPPPPIFTTPPPVFQPLPVPPPVLNVPAFVPSMTQRAPPVAPKPGAFTTQRRPLPSIPRPRQADFAPQSLPPEKKTNFLPLILGAGAAAFMLFK